MQNDKKHELEARPGAAGGLGEDDWTNLQSSLRNMVTEESDRISQTVLTDRIVCAVRPSSARSISLDDVWSGILISWFRPVIVTGMLLIVLLAAYNISQRGPDLVERTTTERVLGMHSVTVVSLYESDLASISR